MKFNIDKKYYKIGMVIFFTFASLILFYKVVDNFSNAFVSFQIIIDFVFDLLKPFITAAMIAYLIYRPVKWIERNFFNFKIKRKKLCRVISILTIYIIFFGILGAFLSFAIPRIAKNITDLVANLPGYIDMTGEFITDLNINVRIQNFIDGLPIDPQILNNYDVFSNIDSYINHILANAQESIENVLGYVISSAVAFTSGIISLILSLFIAFYILKDKEELFHSIHRFLDAFFSSGRVKRMKEILRITDEKFGEYLVGNIIDSTIIGIICFIGLVILNIRFALLISLIVGITNLIPYFGPIIGAVPGIILTLFDSPIKALWVALLILAIQQFDGNYLKPKILGDKVGLNPFWVLFAIIVGGGLFGVLGMFLGVPVVAVLRVLILQAIEKRSPST